jgi:hypothetical protein
LTLGENPVKKLTGPVLGPRGQDRSKLSGPVLGPRSPVPGLQKGYVPHIHWVFGELEHLEIDDLNQESQVYLQQNKKKAKTESKNCHAKTMLSLEKPKKII